MTDKEVRTAIKAQLPRAKAAYWWSAEQAYAAAAAYAYLCAGDKRCKCVFRRVGKEMFLDTLT